MDSIYSVVKQILDTIGDEELLWRMEGSSNLYMQGVDIKPNDIDITTNKKSYEKFRELLSEWFVKEEHTDWKKMHSLIFDIGGWEVEVSHYDHDKINMFDKIEMFDYKGIQVPVLSLPAAAEFYRIIGKEEKVELIKKYL